MASLLSSTLSKLLDYSMVLIEMYFRANYFLEGKGCITRTMWSADPVYMFMLLLQAPDTCEITHALLLLISIN